MSLYLILAWRLLHMTHVSRVAPETLAAQVVDEDEIAVLEARSRTMIMPVGQSVRGVARLAGPEFYRSGRPPGVGRLRMELQQLMSMAEGWRLSQEMYRTAGIVK